jgi:Helix-turn-helix domain
MAAEIITTSDLQTFKTELLEDIRKLLIAQQQPSIQKWLKAKHVRRLLGISPGTLQTLRNNGTLPYSKIGGVTFYDSADIERMFNQRKLNAINSRTTSKKQS